MSTRIWMLLLLVLISLPLPAQSVVQDIERLSELRHAIADAPGERRGRTAALDELVATLAYYATAPDTSSARELFAGADLLHHIRDNQYLINYLLDAKLYEPIYGHTVSPRYGYRETSFPNRGDFLKQPDPAGLFKDSGPFDFNFAREQARLKAPTLSSLTASARATSDRVGGENYVSSAIIGLSDFIAQRAQEELNYTFLTHLRDELDDNNLNYLFPNTVDFLPGLDLLNYKSILPSIRQAFSKDLNQLSFNLGNYLGASNANGYADPRLANILLIYQVLELGFREVSIADILGFTVSRLASNRAGLESAINHELSDTTLLARNGRREIVGALQRLDGSILDLDEAVEDAVSELGNLRDLLRDPTAALAEDDTLKLAFERLKAANPGTPAIVFDDRWAKNAGSQPRGILEAWLGGTEAVAFYQANPSLAYFDRQYAGGAKKSTPRELRTAGLIGVRALLDKRTTLDFYYGLEDTLVAHANAYLELRERLAQRNQAYYPVKAVEELSARIRAEQAAVEAAGKDPLPYDLLYRLTEEIRGLPDSTDNERTILRTKKILAPIEDRFLARVRWDSLSDSPERQRQRRILEENKRTVSFPGLLSAIDRVYDDFGSLERSLEEATALTAAPLSAALGNVKTYSSIFGISQQLFFLLHRQRDTMNTPVYEKSESIAPLLLDGDRSNLLRGISFQRFSSVPTFGTLDPGQLGGLVLDFSTILDRLNQPLTADEIADPRLSKRIRTVAFITQATKTILEAPVLTLPGIDTTFSLAQRVDNFGKVAEISTQFNELFRLSQTGQYRYAITNLLEIIKLFDPPATTPRKSLTRQRSKLLELQTQTPTTPADIATLERRIDRTEKAIRNLEGRDSLRVSNDFFTYATFMADVAAADNSEAFVAALRSVALPRGSSAFKRNNNASLELGALAGLSVGRERLLLPAGFAATGFRQNAVVAAVFMPVGIVYSNKLRSPSKPARGGTYSIFTSILDLGAVAAFRFGKDDSPVQSLPELKIANVIAPGVHLLYQWPRSPFATGVGIQNGPNVRRYDPGTGEAARDLRGYRIMFSATIDVPIFRLWGSN